MSPRQQQLSGGGGVGGGGAFDLEDFIIYLSVELCGHDETLQKLVETADTSSQYLYWRSPILNQALCDDNYVTAPHQSPYLVHVDALFHFARTYVSVQFGGLILEADAAGGRDVTSGRLTLEDLKVLFEQFGYQQYDLAELPNCQAPAQNVAKALKSLQAYSNNADFFTCDAHTVAVTLTLGQLHAKLPLHHQSRGDSDRLSLRLVQRIIQKAIAVPNAAPESDATDESEKDHELEVGRAIQKWKQNKFPAVKASMSPSSKATHSSPAGTTTAASPYKTSPQPTVPPPAKKKRHAAHKPKLAAFRKAPARRNKFSFAGQK